MKIFTYIFFAVAIVFLAVNISNLDFNHLFEGNSLVALIGIFAILCAVVILLIFRISKSIDDKLKKMS